MDRRATALSPNDPLGPPTEPTEVGLDVALVEPDRLVSKAQGLQFSLVDERLDHPLRHAEARSNFLPGDEGARHAGMILIECRLIV